MVILTPERGDTMPRYKNLSGSSYTFFGVLFHPNQVHDVPGIIEHRHFVITDEPETEDITSKPETKTDVIPSFAQVLETPQEDTKRSRRSKGE